VLQTDLLVNRLAASEEYFARQAADPAYRRHLHTGLLPPTAPLHPASNLLPHLCCSSARELHAGGTLSGDGSSSSSSGISVRLAEGWAYQEVDDNQAHKPGWIAREPGATLQLEIDTATPQEQQEEAREAPEQQQGAGHLPPPGTPQAQQVPPLKPSLKVIVAFLQSWQHMGMAQATCVSGCTCAPSTLDGHERVQKHSVPSLHQIALSPGNSSGGGRCVLQLRVLPGTGSGGHKFKLLSLVTSLDVESSRQLAALRHKAQALAQALAGAGAGAQQEGGAPAL
jgi:hypothetical protein